MNIFIVVPSLSPAGPVKGAIALANELVKSRNVVLVVLKLGTGVHAPINEEIRIISLYEIKNWRKRLTVYRSYLHSAGGMDKVASISSCFSADVFNLFCRKYAVTCSSVRGNLPHNYKLDYGWKGSLLAILHLFLLRGFHHVTVMTESMAKQVTGFLGRSPVIIGNFVDEEALEAFRCNASNSGTLRFVFVGSLSIRKKPLLLVEALETMISQGYDIRADFIGDGPLRNTIEGELAKRGMDKVINIHGHLDELHHIVAAADVFVLPSLSEGMSRACLEAMYLGVPAVLRDVDGNSELIDVGVNGFLFSHDSELPKAMLLAAELSGNKTDESVSLLPPCYRQTQAAQAYIELVEKNYD